jgi:hypothetical protein
MILESRYGAQFVTVSKSKDYGSFFYIFTTIRQKGFGTS